MIRSRSNSPKIPFNRAHNGEGTVFIRQMFGSIVGMEMPSGSDEDFESLLSFVHEVTVPPGTSIGLHRHLENEEVYIMVKGQAEMTIDDQIRSVAPGDVILTRDGVAHAIRNSGEEDVLFYSIECAFAAEGKTRLGFVDL
jgi:oxalate decarboxylase/phosphoglucose isomerase-like protein (cupin superfamily)